MSDHIPPQDGFFARHPLLTMILVTLSILVGSATWIARALHFGKGVHGTLEGSPILFWIEVSVMSVIAAYALILFTRVGITTICSGRRRLRF
ncbi:MAG: hypothetical protein EOO77_12845 [Oxalobacteraceae bacterium]|nr:MAG: hypothetical protein EOO77_12845 [Oxalobacteraceae bacterium]